MITNRTTSHASRINSAAGYLVLIAAVVLSAIYFLFQSKTPPPYRSWYTFYTSAKPGWMLLRDAELDAILRGENHGDWNTLAVRTAFTRWRLRTITPAAYENIMRDYDRGLWIIPSRARWDAKFAAVDSAWLARRKAVADPEAAYNGLQIHMADANRIAIQTAHLRTWNFGSVLQLAFDITPAEVPKSPPALYWSTSKVPGLSAARRKLGTVTIDGATTAGTQRMSIGFDLSDEPMWLAEHAVPERLEVVADGIANWERGGIRFADSRFLQPGSR